MLSIFQQYHDLIRQVLTNGERRKDRTGVGTISLFAPPQLRFDLGYCFPAYWGRELPVDKFCAEALWFIKGCPDGARWLQQRGIGYWNSWADKNGDLGRIYGQQWRGWNSCEYDFAACRFDITSIDQLQGLIDIARKDPYNRRQVVMAWQPAELDQMALPPCHFGFVCYVSQPETPSAKLNLNVLLRSSDVIIGLPANVINYAFVAHCIARAVGIGVGELVVTLCGDTHIYENSIDTAKELLQRGEMPAEDALPQLVFRTENTVVDGYEWDKTRKDFAVKNYFAHPAIKTPVAV